MNKSKLVLSLALVAVTMLAVAATDPVLMTINGHDVKLSEFNYLYNKNSQQQVNKEPLDKYLDRYVVYKLKVADAEAAGIDTTAAFRSEFEGYRNDIIGPFLADSSVIEDKAREIYSRYTRNVDIDHMMLPPGKTFEQEQQQIARMDSLRGLILAGQLWDSVAVHNSSDPTVNRNFGHYGYINAGVFPSEFEQVVFDTPVGEISRPFATKYGIHMIRVNASRPDEGQVLTAHIIKMYFGDRSDSVKQVMRHALELVYDSLKAGGDFAELALRNSDDLQTRYNGGKLPWFGRGRMVPEYENRAFAMQVGEFSEPFESPYGFHILKKLDARPTESFAAMHDNLVKAIKQDPALSNAPRQAVIDRMKVQYGFKLNKGLDKYLDKALSSANYNQDFVQNVLGKSKQEVCSFAGKKVTVADLVSSLNAAPITDKKIAATYIKQTLVKAADDAVMEHYTANIINDNADFRNLLGEYRDGMLLFEISDRRVWSGASADTLGLQQYYEANKAKYAWDAPRFKGIILSARNDSVLNVVKQELADMRAQSLPLDTITLRLARAHAPAIKMDRMTVAKGENKLADYLCFGVPRGEMPYKSYSEAMVLDGGLIFQPTSLNDVRGRVTGDYQDVLEKRWIEELRAKYPVKINNKVLNSLKSTK